MFACREDGRAPPQEVLHNTGSGRRARREAVEPAAPAEAGLAPRRRHEPGAVDRPDLLVAELRQEAGLRAPAALAVGRAVEADVDAGVPGAPRQRSQVVEAQAP